MITKILPYSRYIILIAVISSFIASITLLILAGAETIQLIVNTFSTNLDVQSIKSLAGNFIQLIDLLLLGTVFYITSLGLYELFIDEKLDLPVWLKITHLDDLKSILISVFVVILIVAFLGEVVNWNGELNILFLGVGISSVIFAVKYFLGRQEKNG